MHVGHSLLSASHLVQHSRQISFPHPNSTGLSRVPTHLLHAMSLFVISLDDAGGAAGKKDGGAISLTTDRRFLGEFFFDLPRGMLPPGLPPPAWSLLK